MFHLPSMITIVHPLETNEVEIPAQYGHLLVPASVNTEQSGPTRSVEANDYDIYTSCVDKVTVQDGHEQITNNSCSADNDSETCYEMIDSNAST